MALLVIMKYLIQDLPRILQQEEEEEMILVIWISLMIVIFNYQVLKDVVIINYYCYYLLASQFNTDYFERMGSNTNTTVRKYYYMHNICM